MNKPITGKWFNISMQQPAAIKIHTSTNEPIFEITGKGEVIWHHPNKAGEAADEFCKQLQLEIEHKAGIRQTRKDWEEAHKNSIRTALQEGSLTPETLEEIFEKHDFYGRLKGNRD